jgi:hypothetical protein
LQDRLAFRFTFKNDGADQNYGFKDYIRHVFYKYVDEILVNDQDFIDEDLKNSPMSGIVSPLNADEE